MEAIILGFKKASYDSDLIRGVKWRDTIIETLTKLKEDCPSISFNIFSTDEVMYNILNEIGYEYKIIDVLSDIEIKILSKEIVLPELKGEHIPALFDADKKFPKRYPLSSPTYFKDTVKEIEKRISYRLDMYLGYINLIIDFNVDRANLVKHEDYYDESKMVMNIDLSAFQNSYKVSGMQVPYEVIKEYLEVYG